MRTKVLKMIGDLMSHSPDIKASIESSGKSIWLTLTLPGSEIWWELEVRELDQIGLHVHVPHDPNDVCFGPPDEGFSSLDSALARLKQIFEHEPA